MTAAFDYRAYVAGFSAAQKAEFDKMIDTKLQTELQAQLCIRKIEELRRWSPRGYQEPLWGYLTGGGKRAVAIWHRRSGKDDVALNWTARACHERVGEYWHLLPEAAQGRKVVWDAVSLH